MRKAYQCLQHRLLAAVDLRVGDMVGLWSLYGANGKKIFIINVRTQIQYSVYYCYLTLPSLPF